MKYWVAVGVAVCAGTTCAQDQQRKEIRSQAPVFWQDATTWGQPVTGLRMSIEVLRNEGGQLRGLRLAIQNISGSPQGLSLGFLSGKGAQIPSTLILTTPSGRHELSGMSDGAASGGIDPLVIPLLPNALYAVHLPLTSYRSVRPNLSVTNALAEATELFVSFFGDKTVCDSYGYPHPNPVPCWFGELRSNVIRLSPR
jgi:hypothetical protein